MDYSGEQGPRVMLRGRAGKEEIKEGGPHSMTSKFSQNWTPYLGPTQRNKQEVGLRFEEEKFMMQPLHMTDSRDSRLQIRVASRRLRRAMCSETSPQFGHVISRHFSASECIMLGRPNTFLCSSAFSRLWRFFLPTTLCSQLPEHLEWSRVQGSGTQTVDELS